MSESRDARSSEARLALEDIEAIKQLKAEYFWCLDNKDWSGLRALLTDDMQWHTGGKLRCENADGFMGWVHNSLAVNPSVHMGNMPRIEITGPTTATGRWLMHARVINLEDGSVREGFGYYLDDYRKGSDGRWQIACSRLTYFK